jgi:hypothetical protein
MTNPLRITTGEAVVGKLYVNDSVVFPDETEINTRGIYGQLSRQTLGTVTVGTAGNYVSTGLVGTLDSNASKGVALGTTETLALKNETENTRTVNVFAAYDAVASSSNKVFALKLAKNQVPIDETDCRAIYTGVGNAKLVTNWIIDLAPEDEVALYVANITDTTQVVISRCKMVVTPV